MNKELHISPAANKKIPQEIQAFIWLILKQHIPLNRYLQSFMLTKTQKDGKPAQGIRYWAENPPNPIDYIFPTEKPVTVREVFVLCDEQAYTILLRNDLEVNPYE